MSADAREKLLARRRRDGVADGAGFEKTFPWALAVNGVVVQKGRVEIGEVLRRWAKWTLDARQMKEVASGMAKLAGVDCATGRECALAERKG